MPKNVWTKGRGHLQGNAKVFGFRGSASASIPREARFVCRFGNKIE